MNLDTSQLPDNIESLRAGLLTLAEEYSKLELKNRHLEQQVRLLKNELFGRKSEKQPAKEHRDQLPLFNEAEAIADAGNVAEPEEITVDKHTRRKRGRKTLPEHLPRIEVIHDIDESEKTCPCGAALSRIGEDVCEKLDIIPAKIRVLRHVRYKYACKRCEGTEGDGQTVKIAPPPPQMIPKGVATAGFLAHIITAKFEDALPLYRQEKIFSRIGVDIGRATMDNWMITAAGRCDPLIGLIDEEIRGGPIINMDETPVQVLKEPGRKNTAKSYMWVARGGPPEKPALRYQYHPTRAGHVPSDYLAGYEGYLQTDGYSGYEALARRPAIRHVGCWAHARRNFHKVVKAGGGKAGTSHADQALKKIADLYNVEHEADALQMTPVERGRLRQEKAVPLLLQFKQWLVDLAAKSPPKGLLGKAVRYVLAHWELLFRYTEDGLIRPDNNLAENAIRPFVIGRKNWLFAGSPAGAKAAAALYSLIETAKANHLSPYWYLRYLFEHLPLARTREDHKNLLPQYVDKAAVEALAAAK